jgi:hypothetical protein
MINGAWYLIYGLLQGAGSLSALQTDETESYFASGIPFLIGGCFLMRGADWFVHFSYPAASPLESGENTGSSSM